MANLDQYRVEMFQNPRAAATLDSLTEIFPDLQWEEDEDGSIYFNVVEDGLHQAGRIPPNDSRVIWL